MLSVRLGAYKEVTSYSMNDTDKSISDMRFSCDATDDGSVFRILSD